VFREILWGGVMASARHEIFKTSAEQIAEAYFCPLECAK
jgi:hypothetical protein